MKPPDLRLPALRRFAIAITVLNLLGHTVLGFESSWAQLLVALFTAYGCELLLEIIEAKAQKRSPRFYGGLIPLLNFLLPAHITGLAIGMLLYANDQWLPFAFASAVAIGSKAIFTVPVGKSRRHFLNPSNCGLTVSLLLFSWIAIVVPYQFTEDLTGALDWGLPALIICTGSFLNTRYTRRLPLVLSWVIAFAAQAVVRHFLFETALIPALSPMTGVTFLLFTFYMVPDPGTTPSAFRGQVIFGVAVAVTYSVLVMLHIPFGMFIGLLIVCSARGLILYAKALRRTEPARAAATAPAEVVPVRALESAE